MTAKAFGWTLPASEAMSTLGGFNRGHVEAIPSEATSHCSLSVCNLAASRRLFSGTKHTLHNLPCSLKIISPHTGPSRPPSSPFSSSITSPVTNAPVPKAGSSTAGDSDGSSSFVYRGIYGSGATAGGSGSGAAER